MTSGGDTEVRRAGVLVWGAFVACVLLLTGALLVDGRKVAVSEQIDGPGGVSSPGQRVNRGPGGGTDDADRTAHRSTGVGRPKKSSMVGTTSMCEIRLRELVPAGAWPGQRTRNGISVTSSYMAGPLLVMQCDCSRSP